MRDPIPIDVRRATPTDAAEIVRITLEVQAVHVAGRPDLFKPAGVENVPQIDAMSVWGIMPFHEWMSAELRQSEA